MSIRANIGNVLGTWLRDRFGLIVTQTEGRFYLGDTIQPITDADRLLTQTKVLQGNIDIHTGPVDALVVPPGHRYKLLGITKGVTVGLVGVYIEGIPVSQYFTLILTQTTKQQWPSAAFPQPNVTLEPGWRVSFTTGNVADTSIPIELIWEDIAFNGGLV